MKRIFSLFFGLTALLLCTTTLQAQEPYAALSDNNTVLTFYYDTQMNDRGGMSFESEFGDIPNWYVKRSNITTVVFDVSFANCTSFYDTRHWFSEFSNLTTLIGIENLNTVNVRDMTGMFFGCSNLTSLDLSSFKTDNVTGMSSMFSGCSNLTSLNLSSFNTGNVTSMYNMFYGCSSLTHLDLSSFNTFRVGWTERMFSGCSNLQTILVSKGWNMDNVWSSSKMFDGCTNIVGGMGTTYDESYTDITYARIDGGSTAPGYLTQTEKDIKFAYGKYSNDETTLTYYYDDNFSADCLPLGSRNEALTTVVFDKSFADYHPTKTAYWFSDCKLLTDIIGIENLKTDNVTDMSYMFNNCTGLTSLDLSGFNTSNVTQMEYMFSNCTGLTTLDVSGLNTSNVTQMEYMFSGCSGLTSLNVSNFRTENVTAMALMFAGCKNLTSLDLSNFNTSNVTSMWGMFASCSNLTSLNVSSFNTDKVVTMWRMFNGCSSLKTLNLSGFNNTNVENMAQMFSGCKALTNLKLKNFKTDNLQTMYDMFYYCSNLTSLDISSFNTSKVVNMNNLFYGCISLKTIYAGDGWSTAKVNRGSMMFMGCESLVGGQGTTYDYSIYDDLTYARIDGGASAPGYFTAAVLGVNGITANDQQTAPAYNIKGQQVSGHQRGLHIVHTADGTVKKVVIR